MLHIPFNNQYVNLGEAFYAKTDPVQVTKPGLIKFNDALADSLGFSTIDLDSSSVADIFSGNVIPEGAEPLAMAYAGHQFGGFNPHMGDGRAILLGEIYNPEGVRFDMHLKGSGQTAYSRNGDGRSALGPVLREYLVSEAMYKLGVPTTRALAAVTTGEQVARERLTPGGVITRIASSFVRIGTFEYFSSRDDINSLKKLADYIVERSYPEVNDTNNPYESLLQSVVDRQALLIAKWMQLGFIHGVMNTDNMSVAGETIDYGPCAFMDVFSYEKVFSSIDRKGRYAYNNQPSTGLWNLTRFAEALLPLLADNTDTAIEIAQDVLKTFVISYRKNWLAGMRAKCGLIANVRNSADVDESSIKQKDGELIEALLDIMAANHADFTLTFYYLSQLSSQPSEHDDDCRNLFDEPGQFDNWAIKWRERLKKQNLDDEKRQKAILAVNPVYIPRNHQVEAAIRAAEDHDDFSVFHDLYEVLQNPYEKQTGKERYMLPPESDEIVTKTFCGT